MHPDQLDVDATLVRRLLAAQFPDWADLSLERVEPTGTDNVIYRLGEDLAVRLPSTPRTEATLVKERTWLPRLAPLLPLAVPVPVAEGTPAEGYPCSWSVYRWLEGENATVAPIADLDRAADDLAGFIAALQRIDTAGAPGPGEHNFSRGEPLAARDADVRASLVTVRDELDVEAATAVWEAALRAPDWPRPPVWIHGDLDARNLLLQRGRVSAVIDFGSLGVGDPAWDVTVAWKVLTAESRDRFRTALAIDDATWKRARGWAVSHAVGALAYYTLETNPVLVRESGRWLAEVFADLR
jgi:aminoglycoside phosphotransferase (APT) family kinase protein